MKCHQLLPLLLLILLPCHTISTSSHGTAAAATLDSIIRDHAYKALARRRTGTVYDVPLPAELSGVEAAVVRMRSRTFWAQGVRLKSFRIPPKTFTVPYVRRLAIVYQNLGNLSATYYTLSDHSLTSPLFGLLAYDASSMNSSNAIRLDFHGTRNSMSVMFPQVKLREGSNSAEVLQCVRFDEGEVVHYSNVVGANECSASGTGHFAIVGPLAEVMEKEKKRKWVVWVIASACGVVGLVLLGVVAAGVAKLAKRRRVEGMEKKAEDGEALESVWIGGSKMPAAAMVRTQPVIENGSAP